MNCSPRLLLLLAGLVAALPSFTLGAAPKVEETIIGPSDQPGYYVVSATGAHVAFAGKKGDRFVVNVDGVDGPAFDQLLRPSGENVLDSNRVMIGNAALTTTGQYNEGPVLMSNNGEHHAYMGRQGNEIVIIHDGKEIGRGPAERFYFQYNPLRITPNGKQVCWTEIDSSAAEPLYRVVVSGKPGPWAAGAGSNNVVFSGDESRHAYRYTTKDKKHALAVDGKDAGYLGNNPTFTADGKLLITSGMEGKDAVIMVDGKSVAKGVRAGRIFAASIGRRWGALVFRKDAQHNDVTALIIDGKEVADGAATQNVWFSADGKRYAAASHHHFNRGPDYMIVDGKRGTEFHTVPHDVEPFWSPDSSTLIYTAKSAVEPVIVVVANGKETSFPGRLIDNCLTFSERGGHYAFSMTNPRKQNQTEHVVDGQVLPADRAKAGSFVFSADGSRYGNLTAESSMSGALVINGENVPNLLTGYFAATNTANKPPAFLFSADGKHMAAFARESATRNLGLWLDGKVVHATMGTLAFPTFTPDGKNLFWAAEGAAGLVVYVNGQPTARTDRGFFNLVRFIWHLDANGVLSYVGADGDVVKRYRITAAPDTSVATLVANGTTDLAPPQPPPAATAPKPSAPAPVAIAPPPAVTKPATPPPAAVAGPAVALTWNDLVRRPETRPSTCTVNRDYQFQSGDLVRTGSLVNVIELNSGELVLETQDGRITFGAKPQETDILEVANAAWSQLTPAQRDLTYPALLQRMDLWAYHLKLTVPFNLEGRSTRIGDPAILLSREGNELFVRLEGTDIAFTVDPNQTDLMAQARAFLASEPGAPGRLLEEFSDKLVDPMTGSPLALDLNARPKYVAIYMGAGWCGPCVQFSPKLVNVLKDNSANPADVTMIFLSGDRSPAEARTYLSKLGVSWPTLFYKNQGQLPAFAPLFGNVIPQLVVTDRHGKVIIDSTRLGYDRALTQLQQLL